MARLPSVYYGLLVLQIMFSSFLFQLEVAAIVPPLAVYRKIISSLENWGENPAASCEPYAVMRRAYPAGQQSETSIKVEDSIKRYEISFMGLSVEDGVLGGREGRVVVIVLMLLS